jgi:peptidoglycan hydrolase-like protein with peptidoglycan-binding domain
MRFREFLIEAPNPNAAQQPAAPVPNTAKPATFTVDVPKGNKGVEVADLQKALIALGYPLPKFGVDGIRGTETSAAVRKFQQDNQLKVDGIPGQETIAKLNTILAATPDVASKLKKSTPLEVKRKGPAQLPTLKQDAVTKGKIGEILDFIARYESKGNYNIIHGGKVVPELTKMTLNQVYDFQRQMLQKGHESTAVGRYQYLNKTLRNTAAQMRLDPNTTVFDPETQDAIATYTLRFRGLDRWLNGQWTDEQFLNSLAQEWAGIPKSTGGSAHAGVGSNKAGTTPQNALMALQNIKSGTSTATA